MNRILQGTDGLAIPDFSLLEDPRQARGQRYSFLSMLRLCFSGMLGAYRTLRSVIAFGLRRGFGVSYTPLYLLLGNLKTEDFRPLLHRQVRSLYRAKALEPEGFPCHVIAIDNKTLYYGAKRLNAHCQKTHDSHPRQVRFHLRVLRAVLVSSPLKVALDQQVTPPKKNDMSFFGSFLKGLEQLYGRGLLARAIVSVDAGMTSLENATQLHDGGYGYVMALKENQPSLLAEARRILETVKQNEAEVTTGWQVYRGEERRYKLYRTNQMQDWTTDSGRWEHLRQVWLVVTEVRRRLGRKKKGRPPKNKTVSYTSVQVLEERYFLSNVLWNYLNPEQILALVRAHWGIENGCNGTTDTQWNEDESPWCRKGEALEVLSLLRLMAYNLVQWLKGRHLRNQQMKGWGWQEWFDWLREMMALFLSLPRRTRVPPSSLNCLYIRSLGFVKNSKLRSLRLLLSTRFDGQWRSFFSNSPSFQLIRSFVIVAYFKSSLTAVG